MKRNQTKLTRAAELLGPKCDYFGRMYEFDRFDSKRRQEQSEEVNGHLLAVSSWEDTPREQLLCISELTSNQQNLYNRINEKEQFIRNIVWEATDRHKTTAKEEQLNVIKSEESLQILRRTLAREEHELVEVEQKLKLSRKEESKLSYKYKLYNCVLPLECNTISTNPLKIEAKLKRDNGAPIDSHIFSVSDLHSFEATDKLWN